MTEIRAFEDADWPGVWAFLEPVFRAGETYSFATDLSESQARSVWVEVPAQTYIAVMKGGRVAGTYFIKPNQPGQGDHVCNCGYVVAADSRGQGIASRLCEHSQEVARTLGYRAMQYNLVVSTNTGAVRLWQRHGFEIVGTLPGAFRHPQHGFVDAHIMYKNLALDGEAIA